VLRRGVTAATLDSPGKGMEPTGIRPWGLVEWRPRWGLSVRGWISAAMLFVVAVIGGVRSIHPFLAVSEPVEADFLAVEGWLPDYALNQAASEFGKDRYQALLVTGGLLSKGFYLAEYRTHAEFGAATIRKLSVRPEGVRAVPAHAAKRNRTFESAIALRDWFQDQGKELHALNVITLDAHARRTRLVYRRVFGRQVAIGVLSVRNEEYDPARWWVSSTGVRNMISELIGYTYAALFPGSEGQNLQALTAREHRPVEGSNAASPVARDVGAAGAAGILTRSE
jgi:hypothetical protein